MMGPRTGPAVVSAGLCALLIVSAPASAEHKSAGLITCAAYFSLAAQAYNTHGEGGAALSDTYAARSKAALKRAAELAGQRAKVQMRYDAVASDMITGINRDISRFPELTAKYDKACKTLFNGAGNN
jgi:hypothetical protein